MNYAAHYDRLISRAKGRVLDGYKERHHVVPKCMGGGNEPANIVELTGREHWFAHKLLIFIYPDNRRLVHAAVWMAKRAANGRVYEWLRKRNAIAVGNAHRGKKLSPWHVGRLVAAHTGNQYNKGRSLTPTEKARVSAQFKGKPLSLEHREKIASALRGTPLSAERKANISAAHMGLRYTHTTPRSAEHCAKLSAAARGRVRAQSGGINF